MRRLMLGLVVAVATLVPNLAAGNDQAIARHIMSKLQLEQQRGTLKGFHVDMRVDQGTVWYKGFVSNEAQKTLILRTAQRAKNLGVVQVVDDILIRSELATAAGPQPTPETNQQPTPAVYQQQAASQSPMPTTQQQAESQSPMPTTQQQAAYQPPMPMNQQQAAYQPPMPMNQQQAAYQPPMPMNQQQADYQAQMNQQQADYQAQMNQQQAAYQAQMNQQSNPALINPPVAQQTGYTQYDASIPQPGISIPSPQQQAATMTSARRNINSRQADQAQAISQQPVPMSRSASSNMPVAGDNASLPGYAWPSYAAHPNYGALSYPRQYSPTAWPYIGPFYPYPQVPLGWRKVTLEWDDGWWWLDFHNR